MKGAISVMHEGDNTFSSRNRKNGSSDFAEDLRCDEGEIDLSAKETQNVINVVSSEEGIDSPFGEVDQRPTNPDSSEISRTSSDCEKFKKEDSFDG
jgi:hypothetical protein